MVRVCLIVLFLVAAPAPAGLAATDKALLLARDGVAALLRGKYEQAIAAYDEALREGDLPELRRANILNDRGVAKWRLKRTREALLDFNKAIELFPSFSVVYNNRGNALMELGQHQEALADFDRAVALAPAYGAAHNNRGNALYALGRHEQAAESYGRAIEFLPTSAVPLNGRGKAEIARGRPYAAMRLFARAIAINQKYGNAYGNRALALASLDRYSDAIEDYTQAIAQEPQDADLHLARARAYAAEGKIGPAVRDLNRTVELAPASPDAYAERGALFARTKQFKQALADLDQAIELAPDHVTAHTVRASVLADTGTPTIGLIDVMRALEIAPGDARALKARAEIYEKLGRQDEAVADYRAAVERDPGQSESRAALRRLTGVAPAIEVEVVGALVKGWTVSRTPDGRYIATNPDFAKMRAPLELYGAGVPSVVDWTVLKNQFRGIGLLRYFAGVGQREATPIEYVAIVDLWRNAVLSIEPYRWGETEAQWEWREASVVVTDQEGTASETQLRRAAPRPDYSSDEWFYSGRQENGWGPPPRTSRRPARPRGGLFDWLLGN